NLTVLPKNTMQSGDAREWVDRTGLRRADDLTAFIDPDWEAAQASRECAEVDRYAPSCDERVINPEVKEAVWTVRVGNSCISHSGSHAPVVYNHGGGVAI